MMPPNAAATTIDDARSSGIPYLRNCLARIHPAPMNARNIISPNVVISKLPILRSVGTMPREDIKLHSRAMQFTTPGESHGPQLTIIVTGIPAGLHLNRDNINRDLK